ncbi:MAG: hypothetical protein IH607_03525 [Firmicutes bacterium]|nr:hypothetical protein [Bacillota bacterium]
MIAIFGESCVGKSTIADALKQRLSAQVYSGKDYLRFDKNEARAAETFRAYLAENAASEKHIIYVISEKEQLALLPAGCVRVLVTADLDGIKARFAKRMGGKLPATVAAMLEKKHGMFDREAHAVHIVSGEKTIEECCDDIIARLALQ